MEDETDDKRECLGCGKTLCKGIMVNCSCGSSICEECYEDYGHYKHDVSEENIWLSQAVGYANEEEYEETDYCEEDEEWRW